MINKLGVEIHNNNVQKGFYEDKKNIGEMLALIHSEVSEALEADRNGKYFFDDGVTNPIDLVNMSEDEFKLSFGHFCKDTFEDELADVMIRVMDLATFKGIDLESHIKAKMRYNSLRPYKHGKKY